MDFDLTRSQATALYTLRGLFEVVSTETMRRTDECEPAVEHAICADPVLMDAGAGVLDRVLLVEEAARRGAPINATASLLLRPLLGPAAPSGPLCVQVAADPTVPLRFGRDAIGVIDVTGDEPRVGNTDRSRFAPVSSGMVSGYGTVAADDMFAVPWGMDVTPMALHRLGRAAEIAGCARSAIELTASYLVRRRQFGRSLSSFQALRHRLSELAVDVEACSTLVRTAAFGNSAGAMLSACSYAVDLAARIVPELHQMSGARGFMFDSGLPAKTMAIVASRIELAGTGVSAIAHADAVWGA